MATCQLPGWGEAPWGETSWGSSLGSEPGGPLPYFPPFDIFCVGACGESALLPTYEGVDVTAAPGQLSADPVTLDLVMASGGSFNTTMVRAFMDVAVGVTWTLEATIRFNDLPSDFLSLSDSHIFLGAANQQGYCAGLLFSSQGVLYTGSARYDDLDHFLTNGAVQFLPPTVGLLEESVYYTIRIVTDGRSGFTYIYITRTEELPITGHVLQAYMPAVLSSSCIEPPIDGVTLSLAGTPSTPSKVTLSSLCLGSGLIIPNLQPVADAGRDQAARICSIVRLDGRTSFDPEGAQLSYQWRLVDTPDVSAYVVIGSEGSTGPSPPLLVNLFYAPEMAIAEIEPGDVLALRGEYYTISTTGTDGTGFYLAVDGYVLPPGLSNEAYRVVRQRGMSNPRDARPTFYPDVIGIFKFDLVVYDGGLFSEPSLTIVNVVETSTARGITPDLSFLWSYLSDVWKIVEGTEGLPVFWSAVSQIVASELLALWQTDYAKSLRDIQRTFQRRWLHYDPYVQEPLPDQTVVGNFLGGVHSLEVSVAPLTSLAGATIDVASTTGTPAFQVMFQGTSLTIEETADQLRRQLRRGSSAFDVTTIEKQDGSGYRLLVTAPFSFVFLPSSTAPLFDYPSVNGALQGEGGGPVGPGLYRLDRSMMGFDVEGLYLVLRGLAYRVLRAVSDPDDAYAFQRLVVEGGVPTTSTVSWYLGPATTSTFIDFDKALCSDGDVVVYEIEDPSGALAYMTEWALATTSTGGIVTTRDAIGPYSTSEYRLRLYAAYRRTYVPIDPLVVEIPTLQEQIKNEDDTAVLRQNVDYYIERFRDQPCIRFVTSASGDDVWQHGLPGKRMWAETTYLDNRPTIEANFGIAAEFTLDDLSKLPENVDYLSVVRGLWYAYFNGPTLRNLRVGTQILLGLPFAEEAGTIVEVRPDFSPTQGRLLIRDAAAEEIVRSYTYPRNLGLETNPDTGAPYAVGDHVATFAPLVRGVDVVDYVKDPTWFQGYLQQGVFYEVEKFYKFLVRVDSEAFSLPALLFAQSFVQRVKPTYTYPLFVVLKRVGGLETEIDVLDEIRMVGRLSLNEHLCGARMTGMFDDPRAAGGGIMAAFDSAYPLSPPPTYPTPATPIPWGFDKDLLCPEDIIIGDLILTLPAPALPTYDSIYQWDMPLTTTSLGVFAGGGGTSVPTAPGLTLGMPVTSGGSFSITGASFRYEADAVSPVAMSLVVDLTVNGSVVRSLPVTVPAGSTGLQVHLPVSPTLNVTAGQSVSARVRSATSVPVETGFAASFLVTLGATYAWAVDVQTPAGVYHSYRVL